VFGVLLAVIAGVWALRSGPTATTEEPVSRGEREALPGGRPRPDGSRLETSDRRRAAPGAPGTRAGEHGSALPWTRESVTGAGAPRQGGADVVEQRSGSGSSAASGSVAGRVGPAPVPIGERAAQLPEGATRRNGPHAAGEAETDTVQADADGAKQGGDPDVLFSLPLKSDVAPEVGEPAVKAEGVELKDGDVEMGATSMLTFPAEGNVNGEAGTVAFEITPKWAGSDDTSQSFVQILQGEHTWENRMAIVKNGDTLRFMMIDSTGVERNVGVPIPDWVPADPHQVAVTWGDALMSLYVDGALAAQTTYQGEFQVSPQGPILVGLNNPDTTYFGVGGTLRDLKIYNRALSLDEIGR
jgi:hypothetical protein